MLEIERKYLIDKTKWRPSSHGEKIVQGYLSTNKERVVRVRIKGKMAYLTIKGNTQGITRAEFEYEIPVNEAFALLELCKYHPVEKVRYTEEHLGKRWEIDVFGGLNVGLVLAEIELQDEKETLELPHWIKEEVSSDKRYFNARLSQHPYSKW